jgi:hypothetical protein
MIGWLLANSGNMTEKNEHLGPGIDFFVDDMLLSINGNNLVGLELSEVIIFRFYIYILKNKVFIMVYLFLLTLCRL